MKSSAKNINQISRHNNLQDITLKYQYGLRFISLIDWIGLLVFEKWMKLSRIKCRCSFLKIEKYITLSKTSAILRVQKCIKSCGTGTIYNNRKQIKNVCFYLITVNPKIVFILLERIFRPCTISLNCNKIII